VDYLEYRDYETLTCPYCNNSFQNPIKYPPKDNSKKIGIIVLIVIVLIYILYNASGGSSNKVIEYNQSDRKEIYYHDENGYVIKRKTIYYDGRPDEYKYY
jgi:hypothetical protein